MDCSAQLFGAAGKSSIHAGFGIFYSAFEGLSAGIMSANAPYGYDYDSTGGHPLFNEPFVSATTGLSNGQPFPSPIPPSEPRPASQHYRRLVQVRAHHRRSGVLLPQHLALHRKLQPLCRARAGSQHLSQTQLCRLAGTSSAGAHLGESRQRGALPQREPAERGDARHANLRPVQRRRRLHQGRRSPVQVARARSVADFDGITYQKTIGFSNYNSLEVSLRHTSRIAGADGRLHLRQVARRLLQPVRAGLSLGSRRSARPSPPSIFATTSWPATATACPSTRLLRESEPLDQRLVALRHHALLHRTAGHALQQHRQLAAGHHAQRHQQQWRGHA